METELSKKGRSVLRRMRRPGPGMGDWARDWAALPVDQQLRVQEVLERGLTRELARIDEGIHRMETETLPGLRQKRDHFSAQLEMLRRALGGERGGTLS